MGLSVYHYKILLELRRYMYDILEFVSLRLVLPKSLFLYRTLLKKVLIL